MVGLVVVALLVAEPVGRIAASDEPIVVDGRLDDAAWRDAPLHRLALQKEPRGGEPASVETTWQAVQVGRSLYVGIRAKKGAVPIVARRTRRDRDVESDRVFVDIDARGRGQDAFHFEVTAGGSFVDGVRYNDTVLDKQWDAFWDAEVVLDEQGYTVEIEIPLRILRRPPSETAPIHMQVRRYTSKLGETDEWAPTPRDKSREVSAYAPVEGFVPSTRRAALDLLPYATTGAVVETPSGRAGMVRRAGLDAKLQVGTDVAIDATVLPDFGTVEADTAVFNLRPVEVRFPEKRPFFLEGTDVFNTPLEVFYSRRIGSIVGTTAGTTVEAPPPAPVVGATKLLARAGRYWSFGGLVAGTGRVDLAARSVDAGAVAQQRAAPGTVYGALRVRREVPYGGHVGILGTTRASLEDGPVAPFPACPDGQQPVRGTCFADVYALGPDFRIRSKDGNWAGIGHAVGTYRYGGTPEAIADGTRRESGDVGAATFARVEKTGGRVIGWVRHQWYGANADYNATGFQPRPNHHYARAEVGVQTLTPHGPVLEDRWQGEVFERFALDGLRMGSGYQFNHRAKWKSFWRHFAEVHVRPRFYDNREARDGTPVQRAGLLGLELNLDSDSRRAVVGSFESRFQQRTNGQRFDGELNFDFNLGGAIQLRLGADTTVDRGEPRWLETDTVDAVYRLARLNAHALGFITRLNYTITPKLELQLYAQLIGVGTIYDQGYTNPIGIDRIYLDGLVVDPDFDPIRDNEALLVTNVFLRWEYALGSNLFLVVTRTQLDSDDPLGDGRLDYGSIGRNRAAYTFLGKVTRLFGW